MKTLTVAVVLLMSAATQPLAAFDHLSCRAFNELPESGRVLFARGVMGGMGVAVGLVDSAVRAVHKVSNDPAVARGADLAGAGVKKALAGNPEESAESLAGRTVPLCALEEYSGRPAASALMDLLMGIKK